MAPNPTTLAAKAPKPVVAPTNDQVGIALEALRVSSSGHVEGDILVTANAILRAFLGASK